MEKLVTLPPNIDTHWNILSPILTIRNEKDYDRAIEQMNVLIDEIGTNENHPLYNLLDTLGILIEVYEQEHYSIADCDGSEMLAYFMEENGLNSSDLAEIGEPEIIEAILNKQESLNIEQIKLLAQRFNVSPAVFL